MTVARNANPSFTKSANAAGMLGVAITAANTKSDGSGTIATDLFIVLTAGTNDTYVQSVKFFATSTAAATGMAATTARLFLSSQTSSTTTAANTTCVGEINLPAVTADHNTNPTPVFEIPYDDIVPAGYTLLVSNHNAPNASTAWKASCRGAGDF